MVLILLFFFFIINEFEFINIELLLYKLSMCFKFVLGLFFDLVLCGLFLDNLCIGFIGLLLFV